MYQRMRDFIDDSSGATAIEYGLIASIIAIGIIAAIREVGTEVSGTFKEVKTGLKTR